jgi:uncharacterized protein
MRFLNRQDELERLERLCLSPEGGLAVVYGRRRIGKTRLLIEWCRRSSGLYAVADQSTPAIQRRYLAEALSTRFPRFADVEYPDWGSLFSRLATESKAASWRGPLVLDELPYWVATSPELPSVLQRWIDHEARDAQLVVAVAGSSQRMMQGLVLARNAPLFGRARELFELEPLELPVVSEVLPRASALRLLAFYAAWGGVPRYWELAAELSGAVEDHIDQLVLDPRGPLHREPDRLLLEETPSAMEVRPLLDAIGAGAHRVSEIAGRIGRPATSLARPLDRLLELGLVRRDVPFGEPERGSKRSLYRIADPFSRLWFRVVAPHRGELVSGSPQTRRGVLARHWPGLVAQTWEETCRARLPHVAPSGRLGEAGSWKPGMRWWHGNAPEWDFVAESSDGRRLLLGEAKCLERPASRRQLDRLCAAVAARPMPSLPPRYRGHEVTRVVFVPAVQQGVRRDFGNAVVATLADLIG